VLTFNDMSNAEVSKEGKVQRLEGALALSFTQDPQAVQDSKNKEVEVAVVVQDAAEMDLKIIELIDRGKGPEAIVELNKQIKLLESILPSDESGILIPTLLKDAEKRLERVKKEGITKQTRKDAHQGHYMKSRQEKCYYGAHGAINQD